MDEPFDSTPASQRGEQGKLKMQEKFYWLAFSQCNGIGPAKFQMLIRYFKTAKNAWDASEIELKKSGIGPAAAKLIENHRQIFSPDAYAKRLREKNVDFITSIEPEYPHCLALIQRPPYVLFIKGNKEILNQDDRAIAVVGTRKITDYGRQVTQSLTQELVDSGYVIVSGLALGVDAVAHKSAIDAGGKTLAVLGCGIDCCNPRENTQLYQEIIKTGGLIVSEYGLGFPPTIGSFPARNRIIAGLSVGVLVTEGAEDSGSLITAKDAIASGRKVFAVPGPITSAVSRGPISLISNGAKLVTSAKDILDDLGLENDKRVGAKKEIRGDTKEEQMILDLLSDQELSFDELVRKTGLDSSLVGTLLSLMEMKRIIHPLDAGAFRLV